MELVLAAGGAALVSAGVEAYKEDPMVAVMVGRFLRRLRTVVRGPTAHDELQAAVGGLRCALDSSRTSLDGSRRGLSRSEVVRIASALGSVPAGTLLKLNLTGPGITESVKSFWRPKA